MKVAIIGGRNFNSYDFLKNKVDAQRLDISEIISGGAKGADFLAEKYAKEKNIPLTVYPADWANLNVEPCKVKHNYKGEAYNALAGFNRNKTIVDSSDLILAFWDGASPGTEDSIRYAKSINKPIVIIRYGSIT